MNISKLILILGILILLITGYFYRIRALDFKFVDEEYNFTFGKYLSKGERLYDDLITNHQPLAHIISAQVHNLTNPTNTYLLLTKHRETLILYSIFWSLLLIYYFGFGGLIFVIIYELTKINLLGNLFLSESLVIYPLLFLIGTTFFKKELKKIDIFIWGISFVSCVFLLGPILPGLIFLLMFQLFRFKKNILKFVKPFLLGSLLPSLLILKYISVAGYFYYYYFVNLTYTVPSYQNNPIFATLIKSFLTPILSFSSYPQTPTLLVTRLSSLIFFTSMLVLIYKKRFNDSFFLGLIICLGLLNLRFVQPGVEGYSGFHLLPWYSAFIFITFLQAAYLIKEKFFKLKLAYITIWGLMLFLSFNSSKGSLFSKSNTLASYYTNYSTHTTIGEGVRIMKNEGDTLFVSSNAWLVYWQSDADHLPKLYGDYTWMAGYPPLQGQVLQSFEKNPPTFFYCENCKGLALERFLVKYKRIMKNEGDTYLLVLPEKLAKLTQAQKNQLNYHKFSF